MRKRLPKILLALVLLGLIGAALIRGSQLGRQAPEQAAEPAPALAQNVSEAFSTPMPRPEGEPRFRTDEHILYLQPDEQGRIRPEDALTRDEVCRILHSLMENPVEGNTSFPDVPESDPLHPILAGFVRWGILSYSAEPFRPADPVTRAELVTMLSAFYPAPALSGPSSFSDLEGHWAAAAAENALTRGWIDKREAFGPGQSVTRMEFCRMMNRILGRRGDSAAMMLSGEYPCPFADLSAASPYYEDLMEASVAHSHTGTGDEERWAVSSPLTPGLHPVNGRLYYVDENGQVLRNAQHLVWDFASDGRYTTGLASLDDMLIDILNTIVRDDMEDDDDLRAAYLYVKEDHVYVKRPWALYGCEDDFYENAYRALSFLPSEGGCCYDYAAAFGLLARALGYEAYILQGEINEYYEEHGWVIIPEDGVEYIYDTEMEDIRDWRHFDFDLYRINNYWQPYMYWYDELTVTR